MAVILEGGCRVSEMREGAPVEHGTLRIWNQIGRATGAEAISLRVLEFEPGLSPVIRNDQCDEVLYILNKSERAADSDRGAVEDSSQGQARSAPPLDQSSMDQSHPEEVRRRKEIAVLFI